MSIADTNFINMCKDIIENGISDKGENVRPKWSDGTSAYTIKRFSIVNRYDLSKEFPLLTVRKVPIKSCTDEMLWIYSKQSSNTHDLNSHIWDEWADDSGSIGKAYGYQVGVLSGYTDIEEEKLINTFKIDNIANRQNTCEKYYIHDGKMIIRYRDYKGRYIYKMNQMDKVIYDLKNNPYSRRIILQMYNVHDLKDMHLYPCAYSMTFDVIKKNGEYYLNGLLNQRSQDVLVANGWNVCQYAVLLHMLARHCGYKVGELVHVIANAHIYDRHIDIVKRLINNQTYESPKFILNESKNNFYDFTKDDVKLVNYQYAEDTKNIEVAE